MKNGKWNTNIHFSFFIDDEKMKNAHVRFPLFIFHFSTANENYR